MESGETRKGKVCESSAGSQRKAFRRGNPY